MLKRRWRLLLGLALLILVGGALLLPAVHWRVIGWVRGEAFYHGRPSSYWSGEILAWWKDQAPATAQFSWSSLRDALTPARQWEYAPFQESERTDPAALPILVDLVKDPDYRVRL